MEKVGPVARSRLAADTERGFGALEALCRAASELAAEELPREACRIAVEHLGFRMAWVGRVDAHHQVVSVACAGLDEGYLLAAGITSLSTPRGLGPTGRAIRSGHVAVCEDLEMDPTMEPWRGAALARGFRSSAAFPLKRSGKVLGAFSVYADVPRAFSPSALRILSAMASLLSVPVEQVVAA